MGRWKPPPPKSSPYITEHGFDTLQTELRSLWKRRKDVTKALATAAAEGDRSENAEYIWRIQNTVPENYRWPGNVRELEQCIRSICLTGSYSITPIDKTQKAQGFSFDMEKDSSALHLLQTYCDYLYQQSNSYEAVARITQLDRRTVKKYILGHDAK